jgi:hypothetical protein
VVTSTIPVVSSPPTAQLAIFFPTLIDSLRDLLGPPFCINNPSVQDVVTCPALSPSLSTVSFSSPFVRVGSCLCIYSQSLVDDTNTCPPTLDSVLPFSFRLKADPFP